MATTVSLWSATTDMMDTGRHIVAKRRLQIFPDGVEVASDDDATILEASLGAGLPHIHECGGHGRCSTCRVAIVSGLDECTARTPAERALAERLGFPTEVRLACQTRVTGDVVIRRLVLDDVDTALTSLIRRDASVAYVGREEHAAIVFVDIEEFTRFSEPLPPYDVIHFLRRFFTRMERVVVRHGGIVNNYMGDGMLAVFGLDSQNGATLRAIRACLAMEKEAEELKPYERVLGGAELDIRIGLHVGDVVVGALGRPGNSRESVIGDAVNTASRVESANKVTGTRFLVSQAAYDEVRDDVVVRGRFDVALKGKSGTHTLYNVDLK